MSWGSRRFLIIYNSLFDNITIQQILVIGVLVIGTVALQELKSRVPTFPRQIVFVIGSPRCGHTKKGDTVPATNCDVIKHADVTDVATHVGNTCRCVR